MIDKRRTSCVEAPEDTPTCEADVVSPPRGIMAMAAFESFRYRDFRYAFAGALLSNVGSWMQVMALGWVVYELTSSTAALGFVQAASGLPVTALSLFAGALSDRLDRRRLLIWTQALLMTQAFAFGCLYQTGHLTMAAIYALSLAGGVLQALMSPAWQAMTPDLVPRTSLMNAIALNSAQFNAARLLGPMVGGVIFATLGVTEVFYINAVSFLAVIWALGVIRPRQALRRADGESARSILLGGVRYARENPRVAWLLASAAVLTTFGMPFAALLPALARDILGLRETGYSALMSANGFGALASALVVASLSRVIERERIIRTGYLIMGAALLALAATRSPVVAGSLLVLIGASFLAIVSGINTSLQLSTPSEIRGRVMSLFVLAFMGMMPIGAAIFGTLGNWIGPAGAIAVGAGMVLGFGLLLSLKPGLICENEQDR